MYLVFSYVMPVPRHANYGYGLGIKGNVTFGFCASRISQHGAEAFSARAAGTVAAVGRITEGSMPARIASKIKISTGLQGKRPRSWRV